MTKPAAKAVTLRRLLSVDEVAAMLQVPVTTIYKWRFKGEGPVSMRIGRHVRFDPDDLAAWIKDRKEEDRWAV